MGSTAADRFEDRSPQVTGASFDPADLYKPGEAMKYLTTWERLGQHLINLKDLMGSFRLARRAGALTDDSIYAIRTTAGFPVGFHIS